MFETILKCDPMKDHESPKSVLPIFEQTIEQIKDNLELSIKTIL